MPGGGEDLEERSQVIAVGEQGLDRPASSGERDRGEAQDQLGNGLRVVGVIVGEQHRTEASARIDLRADRVEVLGQGGTGIDQPGRIAAMDPLGARRGGGWRRMPTAS